MAGTSHCCANNPGLELYCGNNSLNRLASAYGRLGLYNEAVATINRAIELEPKVAEHRATLGQIQLELGLLGQAEQSRNGSGQAFENAGHERRRR